MRGRRVIDSPFQSAIPFCSRPGRAEKERVDLRELHYRVRKAACFVSWSFSHLIKNHSVEDTGRFSLDFVQGGLSEP